MGAAVSNWRLANAVAREGQLGVVAGTALDLILARRLQLGDPEGHLRRAIAAFPVAEIGNRVLEQYFISGGKAPDVPFKPVPLFTEPTRRELLELCVVGNFVEVFLAKEGHSGPVGLNLLAKIQLPTLPCIYGAMLAGVDYIVVGAGIPREIPGALDRFVNHEPASLRLFVEGATRDDDYRTTFVPRDIVPVALPPLKRPQFLAIVSSHTLASALVRKANGEVNGFVVEGETAGGHNAPPRGPMQIDAAGEPVYSDRDRPDLARFRELGRPFWLAGSYGTPERLIEARAEGAAGVQVEADGANLELVPGRAAAAIQGDPAQQGTQPGL